MEGNAPKIVAILMLASLAAVVVPILNMVETTKVQGVLNEYLTQGNEHILGNRKQIEDYLYESVEAIVGTDKNAEVIMYAYSGTIPVELVPNPNKVPNLSGIKKHPGYYEVSALITRVYWVQKKLVADKIDDDGNPVGKCVYCASDALAERILFVPAQRLGYSYRPPSSDLEFMQDPGLLFEQFH